MKKQLKNFRKNPHLVLGNSFSKNGKEVQRRLQMSLKKKSHRLKMTYGFLGLVLCVLVASAFKINIEITPSLYTKTFNIPQKPLKPKVNKTIPSIKIKGENKIDTSSYVVVKDANDNILNPEKIININPVWLYIEHPKQKKIKVVKMAVHLFYKKDGRIDTETQYFLGNKIQWDNFNVSPKGNILIQVTEILVNNEIINVDKQDKYKVIFPLEVNKNIDKELQNNKSNTAFLRMANLPLYRKCEHNLFLELDKQYKQDSLSYIVNNGIVKRGKEDGEVWVTPEYEGTLHLQVYSQEKLIKKYSFKVRNIPPPTIYLADSEGIKLKTYRPLFAEKIQQLKVVVKSDETFEAIFPQDAKYQVVAVEITQFREGRSVKSFKIKNEKHTSFITIDMSNFELQTGDGFNIKVARVNRMNAKGKIESAPVLRPNIQFSVRVPDIKKE